MTSPISLLLDVMKIVDEKKEASSEFLDMQTEIPTSLYQVVGK